MANLFIISIQSVPLICNSNEIKWHNDPFIHLKYGTPMEINCYHYNIERHAFVERQMQYTKLPQYGGKSCTI